MNKIVVVSLAAILLLGTGTALFIMQASQPEDDTGTVASTSTDSNATAATTTDISPAVKDDAKKTTKIYTNTLFGYSFSYPSSWISDLEQHIKNSPILSIASVHEPKEEQPRRFSVTINLVKRAIKDHAPKTEPITIDGIEATAYIFPDGYECTESGDCSFILIPIVRNNMWYEITLANDAKTLDAYRDILASFEFTN
ncbi:MAG TPA: hypothetical protein VI483_02230 [Candidatus Paceibacterota bacterium]